MSSRYRWISLLSYLRIRALKCYVYLLVWIVIFSAGLYWFLSSSESEAAREIIGNRNALDAQSHQESENSNAGIGSGPVQFIKSESSQVEAEFLDTVDDLFQSSVMRLCNDRELIHTKDENLQHPAYTMDAIVLIFRHGDRGPLSHVGKRNVSRVNCKGNLHEDFPALTRFVSEPMTKIPGYSQFIGPFHSFPKVPTSHACHLGQLTQVGSSQLLHLGQLIRSAYQFTLPFQALTTGGGGPKVIAYCTRYRRTLQSLMAFLYGLLGPKLVIPSVTIRESQSINFCFNDCSCRATNRLQKSAAKLYKPEHQEKNEKNRLVNHLNSVLDLDKSKKTGVTLLDLLLIYPCHGAPLPCRPTSSEDPKLLDSTTTECVTNESLEFLIRVIKKEARGLQTVLQQRQHALLSSYGLLKEILGLALKMTSGASQVQKSRLALFSGHDTTLQNLVGALGIFSGHPDIQLPPFASRLIFEFYRKSNVSPNSPRKHFFRVIYNGNSVTHLIGFCKRLYSRRKTEGEVKEPKEFLCPLENLVRFLHDNYFESFGNSTTNFRDACR